MNQILFALKKRAAPESLAPSRKPPMEHIVSSKSSDSLNLCFEENLFGQTSQELKCSKRTNVSAHEDNCGSVNEDNTSQICCYSNGISQSKTPQHLHTTEIVYVIDPDHSDALGSDAAMVSKYDVGNAHKKTANSYLPAAEPQDSNDIVFDLPDKIAANPHFPIVGHHVIDVERDSAKDARANVTSMTNDRLSGNGKISVYQLFTSSKGKVFSSYFVFRTMQCVQQSFLLVL